MPERISLKAGSLLLCLLMLSSIVSPAAAAPTPEGNSTEPVALLRHGQPAGLPVLKATSPAVPWGRLAGGTALVVGLICAGVYALKKLNGGAPLNKGRYMEVLEARPVGRNVQLILVKVAGRVLLLAYGGEGVTPVAELSEEELPRLAGGPAGLEGFKSLIKKLTGAHQ